MPIDTEHWRRLSPWLDQLLEQPVEERSAWLDQLATREPALADELRTFVTGGAAVSAAQLLQGSAPVESLPSRSASTPLSGQRIGAYTLIEPLGEGGMGAVWLAQRSDGRFEGHAAVKLLHAGFAQRTLAARFKREGAILARLSHPHIARLVDAGVTEDGQPYLVLEHVAGERIDRWCDARRLDLRARVALFDQVLQAVQHAHTQLVVHRDLKPANVMVDNEGRVKLLDFGIAKLLDDSDAMAEATELTRDGGRVLTPLYAAPEQTQGQAVTTATDVYALGLVLYLLLTGQHPRVKADGQTADLSAALPLASRAVVDSARRGGEDLEAAARARGATPARLSHELAGDIDNILAKALRVEPGERYATAAAFAEDLRRHLQGHTVSARPDSLAYQVSRFVGRHKLGVGLASTALFAIVGLAVVADQQRRQAEHERAALDRQRASLEAVAGFLEEQSGLLDTPAAALSPAQRIDRAQRRAEQLFFDDPEVLTRLHVVFHNLNLPLDRPAARSRSLEALDSLSARIDDPVARAEAQCMTGWRAGTAAQRLARVEAALQVLPNTDGARFARSKCLAIRSLHMKASGQIEAALRDLEAAREIAPESLRRLQTVHYLRNKGWLLADRGEPLEADQLFAQAGASMEDAGQGASVRMASDLSWRAMFQLRMGRPRDALVIVERAAALLGRDGPAMPFVSAVLARVHLQLGHADLARQLFDAALLRNGQLVALFPRSWDFTALAHRVRGESAVAVAVLEDDLARHSGNSSPLRDALNRIALVEELLEIGDATRAMAALDVHDAAPPTPSLVWEQHWLRARACNLAGRAVEAESAARTTVAEAVRRAPPTGRSTLHGHAYLELARALAAQGRADESRAAAERAAAELDDALGSQHSATRSAVALIRR